jgi:hypothetical protein
MKMKKIMIAFALVMITVAGFSQRGKVDKRQTKIKSAFAKHHDKIDNTSKGPNGEAIFIGAQGGRYYIKNGKRISVK